MTPPMLTSRLLSLPGIAHGFFGRAGGISEGGFTSLNTGPGSNDNALAVAENRRRCASVFNIEPDHLLTAYQTHSPDVLIVDQPWQGDMAKVDALVTATPGLAVGVLAADCMPWLLADPHAKVVAAAHAGWRGALGGVLENTIDAMRSLGARPERIHASLGPCMRQPNFEVGLDLVSAFTERYPHASLFFSPGINDEKRQFDLAGFGAWRLRESGVDILDDIDRCTLGEADNFFSYRASLRNNQADYGRNLSTIIIL